MLILTSSVKNYADLKFKPLIDHILVGGESFHQKIMEISTTSEEMTKLVKNMTMQDFSQLHLSSAQKILHNICIWINGLHIECISLISSRD
jgi:hypothetical protein